MSAGAVKQQGPCVFSEKAHQSEEKRKIKKVMEVLQLLVCLPISKCEGERSISNQTNKILTKNIQEWETAFGTPFDAHWVRAAERVVFSGLDNLVCTGKVKEGERVNVRTIVCISTSSAPFDVILHLLTSKDHCCLGYVLSRVSWRNRNLLSGLMDGFGSYACHYRSPGHVVRSPDGLSCISWCTRSIMAVS